MGGPMSRNVLVAGHEFVVHDIRRQAAAVLDNVRAGGLVAEGERGLPRQFVLVCAEHPGEQTRVGHLARLHV